MYEKIDRQTTVVNAPCQILTMYSYQMHGTDEIVKPNQQPSSRRILNRIHDPLAFRAIPLDIFVPKIPQKIIIRRLRLPLTHITQHLDGSLPHLQPGVLPTNRLPQLLAHQRPKLADGPAQIGKDARHRGLDLDLFVQRDADGGVQRDGVPDELEAVFIPFGAAVGGFALEEGARGVGTVDFEAFVGRDEVGGFGQAEPDVVEEDGDGVGFRVDGGEVWDLGRDMRAEEPGAEGVVV
jgi:hypothetical protein